MHLEINQWLNDGQPYKAGVAIYEKYGVSTTLKKMFANSDSSFCQEKLKKALQDFLVNPPITYPVISKNSKEGEQPPISNKPVIAGVAIAPNSGQKPGDLTLLSGSQLLQLRANKRSLLTKIKSKPARAAEIPGLEKQIKELTQLIATKII